MQQFFKQYADIFLQQDTHALSALYRFPVTFFGESGEPVSFEKASFDENSDKLFGLYAELGVSDIQFTVEDTYLVSEHLSLTSVEWHFINDIGQTIYSATTRYLLNLAQSTPIIQSVFVVNESSAWQKAKA